MEVICLEDKAFRILVEEVVARVLQKQGQETVKWLNEEQVMQMLNVKSKSTMQKLRDEGRIRFSQPQRKMILYDRDSIFAFLEKHARDTF